MRCFGTVWHSRVTETVKELSGRTKYNSKALKAKKNENKASKPKPELNNIGPIGEAKNFSAYEPTGIGLTFDAEYHSQKKVKAYWKQYYGEEENLNLNEVLKDL